MLSSCLLSGIGIGTISTGLYALITDKENKENKENKDRKIEFCTIFCIVLLVSVLILYFTGKDKTEIVPMNKGSSTHSSLNNNPPF